MWFMENPDYTTVRHIWIDFKEPKILYNYLKCPFIVIFKIQWTKMNKENNRFNALSWKYETALKATGNIDAKLACELGY